jgi:hypothetical protein
MVYLMSLCDFCDKEAKYVFICPKCGNRFCKEHRKPEDHDCQQDQTTLEYPTPEKTPPPIIASDNSEQTHEQDPEDYVTLEETLFTEIIIPTPPRYRKDVSTKARALGAQISAIKIPLAILIIISILSGALMGTLIIPSENTDKLQQRYDTLFEYYNELETYYDNLTRQYSEVREEYILLDSLYSDLVKSNSELKKEFNDIINYQKKMPLASKQTITLLPKHNHSMTYEIPFSGYITVNYTADGEAYVWVGSTSIETIYYSRNPQFPDTSSNYNFTVPVQPDLLVYFANADEFNTIEITFWISFTY